MEINNPFELIADRLERIEYRLSELNIPEQGTTEKPITRKELCQFLGITEPTVIRWERKGKIPCLHIGSAVRYDKAKVLQALEHKKTR